MSGSEDTLYKGYPPGNWTPVDQKLVDSRLACLVGMDQACITNSTSRYPIVGTEGVSSCLGLLLCGDIEGVTVAIAAHRNIWSHRHAAALFSIFPVDTMLDVHVVGSVYEGYQNQFVLANNTLIFDTVKKRGNCVVTSDVYPNKFPCDLAIDTRTRRLIRGNMIITAQSNIYERESNQDEIPLFRILDPKLTISSGTLFAFDGRLPQHQIQKDFTTRARNEGGHGGGLGV